MKKMVCTILSVLLCAGMLSGCGTSLAGDDSVVYVNKKGEVLFLDVQKLDRDFYDQNELETFVDEAVEDYTSEYGKNAVKVESLTVEDGTAKLQMKYKTAEDFTRLHGIELYQGKVVASLAAGYVYDGEFARVENGKVTGTATKQEIYAEEDLKVVVIRANMDVKVDGEICYVSCENVELTGTDSISIREGYYLETGALASVISTTGGESVNGTEQISGSTEEVQASVSDMEDAGTAESDSADVLDDGAFETEVYTFIIYK